MKCNSLIDLDELDKQIRTKTEYAIMRSRQKWRQRIGQTERRKQAQLTFVGTGGNPEAVLAQKPKTAGFTVELGDLYLYVDPGPNALNGAIELGLDLGALDAVYISHGHTDHYGGAEPIIEGMCWAMSARRGYLISPESLVKDERSISEFHSGNHGISNYFGGPETIFLKDRQTFDLKGVNITPIKVYHGHENYGFIMEYQGFKLGYTSDTNYVLSYRTSKEIKEIAPSGPLMDLVEIVDYRKDIKETFGAVDVLIANVTTHNSWLHRHISSLGLAHLLKGSKVKKCYMTHLNYCCVEPEDLRPLMSKYITEYSDIVTEALQDHQVVDLQQFLTKDRS